MLFTSILKWLSCLTSELFITAERPIFLVINHTKNEDFSHYVCRILSLFGADVICLADFYPQEFCPIGYFDGIINIDKKLNGIELSLCKNNKKTYKRTFSLKDFTNK